MVKPQTYRVRIRFPDQDPIEFRAGTTRSIVKSAAAAGYALTSGCLQGRCAICRAEVDSGEVVALQRRARNVIGSPTERPDGCVLLCSVAPCCDLVLVARGPWMPLPV